MDSVSYSYADKQAKRIKKIINDPDSTSGVVTVPKVIASGENITVPAGRIAILPNVQIDGTLNVQGEVFVPSGATTDKMIPKVTSTDNAVVRFNGTTGDVQNSGVTIDDDNSLYVNNSNSSSTRGITVGGATKRILVGYDGTNNKGVINSADFGTIQTPLSLQGYELTFNTGIYSAIERMKIDVNGNVGIGVTPSAWGGSSFKSIDINNGAVLHDTTGTNMFVSQNAYHNGTNWIYKNNGYASDYYTGNGSHNWRTAPSGTAGNAITWNNVMTLDNSGNLLVGTTSLGAGSQNGFSIGNVSNYTYTSTNHINGTGSTAWYSNFSYNGIPIGTITQVGTTSVAYNTTSDYRLKENIRPADCKKFMDIKFVDYERVDGRHECGVIAHELQEIYPDLVTGEKDATEIRKVEISPAVEEVKDEEGNIIVEAVEAVYEEQEFPVYQQVNYMGLIARIGTVVQQQAKLIEAMQLEINELKGAK